MKSVIIVYEKKNGVHGKRRTLHYFWVLIDDSPYPYKLVAKVKTFKIEQIRLSNKSIIAKISEKHWVENLCLDSMKNEKRSEKRKFVVVKFNILCGLFNKIEVTLHIHEHYVPIYLFHLLAWAPLQPLMSHMI